MSSKSLQHCEVFSQKHKATIQYAGSVSDSFEIKSGVMQGCVYSLILFGIYFSMLLKRAFGSSSLGIKLHTRTDGKLSNLLRLRAKRKVKYFTVRDLLFPDHAASVAQEVFPRFFQDRYYRTLGKLEYEKKKMIAKRPM